MITYPDTLDNDINLFLVHDALRLRLAEDYNPGDTSITTEGDLRILVNWPKIGILTLTEQHSDIEDRAISFYYDTVDTTTGIIGGLELLPGFTDVIKEKRTNVTINVTAACHNNLKDAVLAIESFIGKKDTTDTIPLGDTLEGRTNFLRHLVLVPRAWFTADKRTGVTPLEVEFQDLSFRLGEGDVTVTWDFGDNTASVVSTISATSEVTEGDVFVYDVDGGKIKKHYLNPGIFDVTLTVTNDFGSDSVTFPSFIQARIAAPKPATIRFNEGGGQLVTGNTIRSPINTLIDIEVPVGEIAGYSYAGELLNNGIPIDPVEFYTWALADDLPHPNSSETKAAYGVGGIYDLILRVDTAFGAYRITSYPNAIDIVENTNLWLWLFQDSTNAKAYEFGLISETFKTASNTLPVIRDSSFLSDTKQIQEFKKNTGYAPRGTTDSGQGGTSLLYWASGRMPSEPISAERVYFTEYSGFDDVYLTRTALTRPWNWASFASTSAAFFVFGTTTPPLPNTSPTNATKTTLDLISLSASSSILTTSDFENNAQELLSNPALYENGSSIYGNYSVYRTAWKDNTGYIARNDGVGPYFRVKSFYRTEGTVGNPFMTIRKLTDIQGVTKTEGALAALSNGVYFFNNSGSISVFNDVTSTWSTGGPGVNSVAYRALQDTSVSGFDKVSNTLLVASDGDHRAYLSFDYSNKAFIKFNEIDTTFKSLGDRPLGDQWLMGVS